MGNVGKLSQKLQEAVRKLSYKTTVDELKKKGIQRVNVVGLDRIVALIEAAVHRTLKQRIAGFEGIERRGEIATRTREEFLKLLNSKETLERARDEVIEEKEELQDEVLRLREELRSTQTQLSSQEAKIATEERMRHAEADQELQAEIDELMFKLGLAGNAKSEELVRHVLELTQVRLDAERERVAEARRKEYQSEVELLNRRLSKLNGTLQETEKQLMAVMRAKNIDDGIASIYKDVQGLDNADNHYETKKELMSSIFEANLRLQGKR
ncbi:MAG: hypothetical protein KDC95_08055 [Planctomycetes bacterium]|nr:hypothetical protein [Planctomycetota bacterium]